MNLRVVLVCMALVGCQIDSSVDDD